MEIIVIKPTVSYTDYCIMYRKIKGKIKRCLSLLTFCQRMKEGKTVTISDASKEVYKLDKTKKPIKIVFKMNGNDVE